MVAPHNCFGCGTLNIHGLRLALHSGDGRCWIETTLDGRFEGWDGIAHGGVITAILDEVMAWSVVEHDLWGVTARLSVEFKRPVAIGVPIRGEGRVTSVRRRLVETEGRLVDANGILLALATATFVGAPPDRKAELKARYGFVLVPEERNESPGMVDAT